MSHASEEFRYSTRDFYTQRVLQAALTVYVRTNRAAYSTPAGRGRRRAERELEKLKALIATRREGWSSKEDGMGVY